MKKEITENKRIGLPPIQCFFYVFSPTVPMGCLPCGVWGLTTSNIYQGNEGQGSLGPPIYAS